MTAPAWATSLVARICEDRGVTPPPLTWRRSRVHTGTSGRWFATGRITIDAGTDRADQRIVLIHEVAHHLAPNHHHDGTFWGVAWELFRAYRGNVTMKRVLAREAGYKATAGRVARAMGIPGAKAASTRAAAHRRATTRKYYPCPLVWECPHLAWGAGVEGHRHAEGTVIFHAGRRYVVKAP
jgi:hypothetical protein